MVSTSGHDLIGDEAFQIIKNELLTFARIVTPNIPEAERLTGISINNDDDMRRAAEAIKKLGAENVLIKGGHKRSSTNEAIDVLLNQSGEFYEFREEYFEVGEIHGSGCTLSAAIASYLSLGRTVEEAVAEAKRYISESIRKLEEMERIGHGARPI